MLNANVVRWGLQRMIWKLLRKLAPNSEEAADILRQDVNEKLGTSIPMAKKCMKPQVEYQAALDSGDKELENAALVHLKEVQRDSGKLRNWTWKILFISK